jgi:hypothetical protein
MVGLSAFNGESPYFESGRRPLAMAIIVSFERESSSVLTTQ